jgi:hypothetical protein
MTTLGLRDLGFVGGLGTASASYDADTQAWIDAVEAADGASLETYVKEVVDAFVVGCKADSIWDAIKLCGILGGARTRTGAMTHLVGSPPTSFSFVNADYDRRTGLKSDGTAKYLDTNRNNNADPQDSKHLAAWKTEDSDLPATNNSGGLIGTDSTAAGSSWIFDNTNVGTDTMRVNRDASTGSLDYPATGFVGVSRDTSTTMVRRFSGTSTTVTGVTSTTPLNGNLLIFRAAGGQIGINRIIFYSAGEHINLELLDARVETLVTALAAIP